MTVRHYSSQSEGEEPSLEVDTDGVSIKDAFVLVAEGSISSLLAAQSPGFCICFTFGQHLLRLTILLSIFRRRVLFYFLFACFYIYFKLVSSPSCT